ncbi:TIM barrel protein [Methylobacterium nodulans]|uniref:Xylose isomerase domain protein TIM barrel n=1 Tax=Methylobacterium nodulans (strain LMG 21967 / CNCM I-2342 / ORS 2060) TaxID=460265 RepID=B8IXK7_METNO|nr:TIM barrel protein [Methylobacterium nodulans]ACL62839.1 Xylose isomerase domain protein TIM barrel [Methylobacterium nodulans ORS 2060]
MRFALNHILAPKLPLEEFFASARALGATEVEIRNDLPDVVGTVAPEEVRTAAEKTGVSIISIKALYPFNVWTDDMAKRAAKLAAYAAACGAKALVMCPLNEGKAVAFDVLVASLKAMKPILLDHRLTGLVEPLGFPVSSLRTKKEAIAAIRAADGADTYRLVHDTFHHHLAGETEFFPEWTGLVHISGVTDPIVAVADMLDAHRVLVDGADRLENIPQIRRLIAAGYSGPFSFEPFATEVHELEDPKGAAKRSMDFVSASL